MNDVYILYKNCDDSVDIQGIFSSFEKAQAAGNDYASWTSNEGPFEWERTQGCWTLRPCEQYQLTVYRQKLDRKWWQE